MIREKKGIGMIAAIILAVIFTAAALHFTGSRSMSSKTSSPPIRK